MGLALFNELSSGALSETDCVISSRKSKSRGRTFEAIAVVVADDVDGGNDFGLG